jgi:putative Mg2+ transporter-C (MgtC) family protein
MHFIQTFGWTDFLDSTISLIAAFVLGTLIGAERQYRQRNAGLRTNALVAVAAASFVDLAMNLGGPDGATRVISYVVSGIGFLGAGVIMKEGLNVRGLNTAATLWCSAAVGACAGGHLLAQAALLTLFTVAGNTLLRPLVNAINRIPFDEQSSEATYEVDLLVAARSAPAVREQVEEMLDAAKYPVSDIDQATRADGVVEITATLVSTSVDPDELNKVVADMRALPGVAHANWSGSTKD